MSHGLENHQGGAIRITDLRSVLRALQNCIHFNGNIDPQTAKRTLASQSLSTDEFAAFTYIVDKKVHMTDGKVIDARSVEQDTNPKKRDRKAAERIRGRKGINKKNRGGN